MTIYTILAPPLRKHGAGRDETRFLFVKEGFCWPGLLIAPLWLIFRRMWIVLAFYVVAMAAMGWFGSQQGLMPLSWGLGLFVPLLLGFEGNDLRRWSLGLRGYDFVGVVEAASRAEAEIRFFAGRGVPDERPAPPPVAPSRLQPLPPPPPVIGLFPSSGAAP